MKNLILLTLFSLLITSCAHKAHHGHDNKEGGGHHRFADADKWAAIFEDDKRASWQRPGFIMEFAGIKSDSIIADIGSATGFFPIRLSARAHLGRVWGIDVEPNLVNYLNERARREGVSGLYSILGTYTDPLIPEKVDFIFVINTYHHISERAAYFARLKKVMNKKARLVIVDFKKGDLPFGPKDAEKISHRNVKKEMKVAGFTRVKHSDELEYQFLSVFEVN
jgi:cyclopropane fatty-acyl-phospholipid synthase-like methyltransferase